MRQATHSSLRFAMLALAACLAVPAAAGTHILSGTFDGSESALPPLTLAAACYSVPVSLAPQGLQQVELRVSESGSYTLRDIAWYSWHYHGAKVTVYLYQGRFRADLAPLEGSGTYGDTYHLVAGGEYTLVVQQRCETIESAWGVIVRGPGTVDSAAVPPLPALSTGVFSSADPTMTSDCGSLWGSWGWGPVSNAPYRQVGPVRVSHDGTYYYTALGDLDFDEVLTCLAVYSAPVDPVDRNVNRLALLGTTYNTVRLEAGRDYWFVTHWGGYTGLPRHGRFTQVLSPPAPFRLNAGLSGGWYDPERPGEGYFLTVLDSANQAFLAHLAFDASAAGSYPPHRWTTALGPFQGAAATLEVVLTEGGGFDSPWPAPRQIRVGSLRLEFSDCANGTIAQLEPDGQTVAGAANAAVPIVRLANDAVPLCESLYAGPGRIGPL